MVYVLLGQVSIKYKAISEPQPNGKVEVFFEVNGVPRVVEVAISAKAAAASGGDRLSTLNWFIKPLPHQF